LEIVSISTLSASPIVAAVGDLLRSQLTILRRLVGFTLGDAMGLSRTVVRHAIELER
jgi:hypothetical protein